jgi:hypothetical protein
LSLTIPLDLLFTLRGDVGCVFKRVSSMATAALNIEGRRAQRDIVSFRAPLDGPAGIRTTVFMVDISPLGFMSRSSAALAPGDVVAVKLPVVGARAARIVWSMAGRVGGEFIECIGVDQYARMLAGTPHDRPNWNEV